MAFETVEIEVGPEDGWVKVADDPSYVKLVIRDARPWALCATPSGAPSDMGASAAGTVTFSGQPVAAETMVVGPTTYTFRAALAARDIRVMPTIALTRNNLLAALVVDTVTGAAASGTDSITIGPATASITITEAIAALSVTWQGIITFSGLPTATQTVTVGSTVYTFVASAPGTNDVLIGVDAAATRDNLLAKLLLNVQVSSAASGAAGILVKPLGGVSGAPVAMSETATNVVIAWNATITFASQPTAAQTIIVGANTYTFRVVAAGDVPLGSSSTLTRDSLLLALATNTAVVAAASGTLVVALTASTPGVAGNLIVLTEAATNVAVSGSGTLASGADKAVGVRFVPNMQSGYGYDFTLTGATTAEFYVRVWQAGPSKSTTFGEKTVFGVIRNNA